MAIKLVAKDDYVTIGELAERNRIRDIERVEKLLLLMLHLTELFKNAQNELEAELRLRGLFKMDVKSHLNAVRRAMKGVSSQMNWSKFDSSQMDMITEDAERFELMVRQFCGLEPGDTFLFAPQFPIGSVVWDADSQKQYKLTSFHTNVVIREKHLHDAEQWYEGLRWDTARGKVKENAKPVDLRESRLSFRKEEMLKATRTASNDKPEDIFTAPGLAAPQEQTN